MSFSNVDMIVNHTGNLMLGAENPGVIRQECLMGLKESPLPIEDYYEVHDRTFALVEGMM